MLCGTLFTGISEAKMIVVVVVFWRFFLLSWGPNAFLLASQAVVDLAQFLSSLQWWFSFVAGCPAVDHSGQFHNTKGWSAVYNMPFLSCGFYFVYFVHSQNRPFPALPHVFTTYICFCVCCGILMFSCFASFLWIKRKKKRNQQW